MFFEAKLFKAIKTEIEIHFKIIGRAQFSLLVIEIYIYIYITNKSLSFAIFSFFLYWQAFKQVSKSNQKSIKL